VSFDWNALSPTEQAEASVIAGALRDNDLLDSLSLGPDDFLNPRFSLIWEHMVAIHMAGEVVDPITVGTRHPEQAPAIWQITDLTYTSPEFHAEVVREAATRRKLMLASVKVRTLAEEVNRPLSEIEEEARAAVDAAVGIKVGTAPSSGDVVASVIAGIGKAEPAFRTPWNRLTSGIRGFRRGGLYVIGARPGVGKSVVALQCARMLENYGHVGYFTLEMGKDEVSKRLIAQETEVAYSMIDGARQLPDWAAERIEQWRAQYPGRILFDDRGSLTIGDIRSQVRTWAREHDLAGVAIDYLQLMTGSSTRGADRVAVVGEISRQLKLLARDFDIPVIALSQLNRNPEQRADKMPALSDLRESGSIEQDADVVILLHRDMDLTSTVERPEIDFIVAKSRQGPTGMQTFEWQGEFMRAVEIGAA
jgi:replicative DNA helicase